MGKMRALWFASCDKAISKYLGDCKETSDCHSIFRNAYFGNAYSRWKRVCTPKTQKENINSTGCVDGSKGAFSSQQRQGSVCGEIRLWTSLAFQMPVSEGWVGEVKGGQWEKPTAATITVNQLEEGVFGKSSEYTSTFFCLLFNPQVA